MVASCSSPPAIADLMSSAPWFDHHDRLYGEFLQDLTNYFPPQRQLPSAPSSPAPSSSPDLDNDLLAWSQCYLPHHFQAPPSQMHREVAALLDEASQRSGARNQESGINEGTAAGCHWQAQSASAEPPTNSPSDHPFTSASHSTFPTPHSALAPFPTPHLPPLKLNVLAPRGSAKSTLVTLSYALREALLARQKYIWIISDTKHQAVAHLENIRAELEDNQDLTSAFPHARPLISRGNRLQMKDVQIEAFGTGQRIRGRRFREHRPTLIICDDLQNDGHIYSARQRDHTRTWFHGMLLKAGTKQTQIINLGTALHREAISVELQNTPGWTNRKYPAIQAWPTNMQLWAEWEELHRSAECGIRSAESQTNVCNSSLAFHSALPTPNSALAPFPTPHSHPDTRHPDPQTEVLTN